MRLKKTNIYEFISKQELRDVEKIIDTFFEEYGIDIVFKHHFWERINHPRNGVDVTGDELIKFFAGLAAEYGGKIADENMGYDAIANEIKSKLNVAFVLEWDDRNYEIDLITKTAMRTNHFFNRPGQDRLPFRVDR
jgi:hypothetical protein